MVFSRRKMKQLFAFGVAIVLVICLYKSWGNPASAKLTLGIGAGAVAGENNELEPNPERSRYVVGDDHQRQSLDKVVLRRHPAPMVAEEADPGNDVGIDEVHQAKQQIRALERKIQELEGRIPRKYPDVTFLNYKNRKRILITGGAGFVGSHLVDYLMMQGHEVIVVDNFFTGRKRNVEHWLGHENFELIHHDIVNPLFIEVDEIYHLASPASPPHYMYNPVKTIKTNTLGTINMLGLAKRVGAKVLIASTSEVYGDPDVHPQPETYWGHVNPIGPRACYDEGKRVAETLAYAYAKQENVNVRVARIFNTYGPRMHMNDGRVVSNFIIQALQNQSITMYGSGKQTRSFQYVSDLVDGLVALMASNYTLPVNLGNPVERTIEEFAELIRDSVGCRSCKIVELPAVEDDPQRRKPDIARAKRYLDWEPRSISEIQVQEIISEQKFESSLDLLQESSVLPDNPVPPPQQQLQQQQHHHHQAPQLYIEDKPVLEVPPTPSLPKFQEVVPVQQQQQPTPSEPPPAPPPVKLFDPPNDRTCEFCGKEFSTRTKLKIHRNTHLNISPFKCPVEACGKAFKSKIGLDEHVAGHTGNYPISCNVCGKGFVNQSYLTAHLRIHAEEKTFRCNICKQATFKTKKSLVDHKNRHLGLKPFECGQCGKVFTNQYLLQQHEQVAHSGVRFPCPECSKSFTCKSYLKVHLRIHRNERPFVCAICDRGHVTKRDLDVHMTLHTGKKQFICDICGKDFARLNALQFHRKIHESGPSSSSSSTTLPDS